MIELALAALGGAVVGAGILLVGLLLGIRLSGFERQSAAAISRIAMLAETRAIQNHRLGTFIETSSESMKEWAQRMDRLDLSVGKLYEWLRLELTNSRGPRDRLQLEDSAKRPKSPMPRVEVPPAESMTNEARQTRAPGARPATDLGLWGGTEAGEAKVAVRTEPGRAL